MFATMTFYDDLKQVLAWPRRGDKNMPTPQSIAATIASQRHEIAELKRENAQLKVRERSLGPLVARLDATEPALLVAATEGLALRCRCLSDELDLWYELHRERCRSHVATLTIDNYACSLKPLCSRRSANMVVHPH